MSFLNSEQFFVRLQLFGKISFFDFARGEETRKTKRDINERRGVAYFRVRNQKILF